MPTDSDDEADELLDRWADAEQPFGDPEESSLIPEAPSVTDYEEPDARQLQTDLSDVNPELLNVFAVSVVLANVGVLLISVGILLAFFRGMIELGGGMVVVGAAALLRVRQHYYEYKRGRDEATAKPTADSSTADEPTTDAPADKHRSDTEGRNP